MVSLEPLRRRLEMHLAQTRERMRTTPRVILNLKQAYSAARLHETLAPKLATTWLQEFTRMSHTAPRVHLQESRQRTALTVNRSSAVEITRRRAKQTRFCWPFSSWQVTTFLQISMTISTEFLNCQNRSRQRCPGWMWNLRSLSCLKIFFRMGLKIRNQVTEDDSFNYFHSPI